MMDAEEMILLAAGSAEPRAALQRVMQRMLEAGMERAEVLAALEGAQKRLRAQGADAQAELAAELLDGFEGWCRV